MLVNWKGKKNDIKKDIMLFRKELNTYLDKMEHNMLKDLATLQEKQTVAVNEEIVSLTAALERLSLELEMLEHAKQFDRKETMFASEMKVLKSLKEYETLAGDMHTYGTKPVLSFKKNKKITDILRSVDTLGCLKINMEVDPCSEKRKLKELGIRSSSQVDIPLPSDGNSLWISGCCFILSGDVVICDFLNKRLTLLDQNVALKDKLDLTSGPYSVSAADNNNVIITLPLKQQIQYVQIFPTMKAGRVIEVDKTCYGIYVFGGKLYTSLEKDNKGEVCILDLNGNLEKKIDVSQDGTSLFQLPYCITISETGDEIFDGKTDIVTCMSADGHVIYQCKDDEIKGPRGIYVDAWNNVYVCGKETNNIAVITADGRFCRYLVSASEGLQKPCSVAFRGTDKILVVGCCRETNLFCFKLE